MGVAMPRPRVPRRRTLRGTCGPVRGAPGRSPLRRRADPARSQSSQRPRGSTHATRCASSMRVECVECVGFRADSCSGDGRAHRGQVAAKLSRADSTQSSQLTLGDAGHRLSRVRSATTATSLAAYAAASSSEAVQNENTRRTQRKRNPFNVRCRPSSYDAPSRPDARAGCTACRAAAGRPWTC